MDKQELIKYLNDLIKNIEDSNLYLANVSSQHKPFYINEENIKVDTTVKMEIVYGVNHEE